MIDRDELAEWWQSFDGPAYPTGEQVADAILSSEWLAKEKAEAVAEELTLLARDCLPGGQRQRDLMLQADRIRRKAGLTPEWKEPEEYLTSPPFTE